MVGGVIGSGRGVYESGRAVKIWENGRGSPKVIGAHSELELTFRFSA